ncbi:hypothetical protein L596_030225 [Steinernema carpocapsae]|uniref:Uncharacterized protein n=1 Tax=Steinernema carpocapsae TaxID=34508 RepID=A0A4U5LS41_STECR|nr:hypothetical protein L596_030225 [Steinernema carpocapsae]
MFCDKSEKCTHIMAFRGSVKSICIKSNSKDFKKGDTIYPLLNEYLAQSVGQFLHQNQPVCEINVLGPMAIYCAHI